jgi:hypothetical protein
MPVLPRQAEVESGLPEAGRIPGMPAPWRQWKTAFLAFDGSVLQRVLDPVDLAFGGSRQVGLSPAPRGAQP